MCVCVWCLDCNECIKHAAVFTWSIIFPHEDKSSFSTNRNQCIGGENLTSTVPLDVGGLLALN